MKKWLVCIDWENISISLPVGPKPGQNVSMMEAISSLLEVLEKSGEIVLGLVFCPEHAAKLHASFLHERGLFIVRCPKIGGIDATDENLISMAEKILAISKKDAVDSFCLCAGDGGYAEMLEQIREKGIGITIAVGDSDSLSGKLIGLANDIYNLSLRKQ